MKPSHGYRARAYNEFVSKHWNYSHTFSTDAYDLFARVARKRFYGIIPDSKSARIIDLACGAGHFLYYLQKEGYTNTRGIDLSKEQLGMASQMGVKNIDHMDLFDFLPAHPQCFDMVVANDIIEHLSKDEVITFLDHIHRSLVPGGHVLICTINAQSLFGAGAVYVDFTHEQGFTATSLAQALRICNFENVEVYGEKPVVHDVQSAIRSCLWWCCKQILNIFVSIQRGTGRGLWKCHDIFEPRIFAVGRKNEYVE